MMNKAATVILIVAVFGAAQGDIWSSISGLASDVGKFFKTNFNKVQDLFANDETTLAKNVNTTQTLLSTIQSQRTNLAAIANDTQKAALNRVDYWATDLKAFATTLSNEKGQTYFAAHKVAWESKLHAMFETDKLQSLLPLLNSAGPVVVSLTTLLLSLGVHFYLNN
uniref:Uncharacterized protein n=1 Tax=Plectus sambesii TaxID=2011161 RepID=A0A914WNN2_9BILA